MSTRIFQNVIIQMKDAVGCTLGVVDEQGYVIASSELAKIGSRLEDFRPSELEANPNQTLITENRCYRALSAEGAALDYAAFVDGSDASAASICAVAVLAALVRLSKFMVGTWLPLPVTFARFSISVPPFFFLSFCAASISSSV